MDIVLKTTDDVKDIISKGASGPSARLIKKYMTQHPELSYFTMPSGNGQINVVIGEAKAKAPTSSKKKTPVKKKATALNKTEEGILSGSIMTPSKIMAAIDKGSIQYKQLNPGQQSIVRSERSKRSAATRKNQ